MIKCDVRCYQLTLASLYFDILSRATFNAKVFFFDVNAKVSLWGND